MQKASFHSLKNKQSRPKQTDVSINFSESKYLTPKKPAMSFKKNLQSVETCFSSTRTRSLTNFNST